MSSFQSDRLPVPVSLGKIQHTHQKVTAGVTRRKKRGEGKNTHYELEQYNAYDESRR